MLRLLTLVIALVIVFSSVQTAHAIDLPVFGPFPSLKPFPTKTPKPSATPNPTLAPSSSATPQPSQAPTKLEVEDVEPSSANFMEEFTIYGTNFGAASGNVSFRHFNHGFSSGGAPIISWSDTEITAKVPAVRKGSYRIQVITGDNKKSNEIKFTVKNGQPYINSTSLNINNDEAEITFQGSEFGRRGSIDIYNGTDLVGNGIIKSWSTSRVRFEVPALPEHEYGFQLTTADGRKSSFKFFTVGN